MNNHWYEQPQRRRRHATTSASASASGRPPSPSLSSSSWTSWGNVVTAAVVVAYGTYRVTDWAWRTFLNNEPNDHCEHGNEQREWQHDPSGGGVMPNPTSWFEPPSSRRQASSSSSSIPDRWRARRERMMQCRREVIKTLQGFQPTLRRIIEEKTDLRAETKQLKRWRAARQAQQQKGDIDKSGGSKTSGALANGSNASIQENSSSCDANEQNRRHEREMQEQDLWDAIQMRTVTRIMVTAYAHIILFLVLTVQVHLLAGRIFWHQHIDQPRPSSNSTHNGDAATDAEDDQDRDSLSASHRLVLMHTYDYFFEQGLETLVQTISRAVQDEIADWNALDPAWLETSHHDVEHAIANIRTILERGGTSRPNRIAGRRNHRQPVIRRSMMRFLIPPSARMYEHHERVEAQDGTAAAIMDEIWDLMESPIMADAEQDACHAVFERMQRSSWSQVFFAEEAVNGAKKSPSKNANTTAAEPTENESLRRAWVKRPLAQVLTQLKNTCNTFYGDDAVSMQDEFSPCPDNQHQRLDHPSYGAMLEALPTVLELADVSFG